MTISISRLVCDAERLDNDPMEAKGQGVIYRQFGGYKRGLLTSQESDFLYLQRKLHLDAHHLRLGTLYRADPPFERGMVLPVCGRKEPDLASARLEALDATDTSSRFEDVVRTDEIKSVESPIADRRNWHKFRRQHVPATRSIRRNKVTVVKP